MKINEINKIEDLANDWESYKEDHKRRDKEVKRLGESDLFLTEQLKNMSDNMGEYRQRLEDVEVKFQRPFAGKEEYHDKGILASYLKSGEEAALKDIETKSLSVGSEKDGGYLVPEKLYHNMVESINNLSPMRNLCSVEKISTSSLDIIDDYETVGAGWTSEMSTVNETDTPTFSRRSIQVHEIYAQPKATQKLIDDASINIESWLEEKIQHMFARIENDSFINGDGNGKPRGILSYANGVKWGEIEQVEVEKLSVDSLYEVLFRLKEEFASRAHFIMNRSTLQYIRTLKDKDGRYIWSPGLASDMPDSILGVSVVQVSDMPLLSNNTKPQIAIGDFKAAYQIVDRVGIRVMRDALTEKPFVKFYCTKRVGGDIKNFQAIKLLRIS